MAARAANVFNIPAGFPFARALAEGVVRRFGRGDPLALSQALILVPTRRAVRSLREEFASVLGGAALLPDIRPLGDAEEESIDAVPDVETQPAITPLRRRLLLATLVERWEKTGGGPVPFAQAVAHAKELARFLDECGTQGCDLSRLDRLASADLASHWQDVLRFLDIVTQEWPKLLAAEARVEPTEERNASLRRLAARLAAAPPNAPVIAAGSTGSIPATAELLKTIAYLENGTVVLPALDTDLDDASWEALEPAHAQFGLRQLLTHIGIGRDDVAPWLGLPASYPSRDRRVRFFAEALRPPPTTDAWRDLIETSRDAFDGALDGVAQLDAANPREEALAIACALRESVETPGRTAALVTPDRGLARRVAAELQRWNIAIDDSAGQKPSSTPAGAFLSLLARAVAEDFAPIALLALLKHPFSAAGQPRARFLNMTRELELLTLRGLRPAVGLQGIADRIARSSRASAELKRWFAALTRTLTPLAETMTVRDADLGAVAAAHVKTAEALAATDAQTGAAALWKGAGGEVAAGLLNELIRDGAGIGLGQGAWYAELFRVLAEERPVRPPYSRHARLSILGPLEARLLHFDLVVLGGLNDGTWPAETKTDPWLSRPMRAALGLDPPERRTGLAAHDVATLAAAPNVLMTRSLKSEGAPTIASRWLLRLQQLAKGLGQDPALHARDDLLIWARAIDRGRREPRNARPAPRPPVAARPREMRITEIETWLRDPYAIYAKYVLRLKPLEPLDQEPGPRERGIAIHAALERFLTDFPQSLPEEALDALIRYGRSAFEDAGATRSILALWGPRFQRAARWFFEYEKKRRVSLAGSIVEAKGTLAIASANGFTLKGRADRIDIFADSSVGILDYKTGRVPSHTQIEMNWAPQLPLEGAMLLAGAFGDLNVQSLRELTHVRITGTEPAGEECIAKVDPNRVAAEALQRLTKQVALFENEAQPYISRLAPERVTDVGEYDHLARVAEWSVPEEIE